MSATEDLSLWRARARSNSNLGGGVTLMINTYVFIEPAQSDSYKSGDLVNEVSFRSPESNPVRTRALTGLAVIGAACYRSTPDRFEQRSATCVSVAPGRGMQFEERRK
jgi:hypothetical protein